VKKIITVPNSSQAARRRTRDAKVTLPCTVDQKEELTQKATAAGLSVSNFLRLLLHWPLEEHGARKDLAD